MQHAYNVNLKVACGIILEATGRIYGKTEIIFL